MSTIKYRTIKVLTNDVLIRKRLDCFKLMTQFVKDVEERQFLMHHLTFFYFIITLVYCVKLTLNVQS